MKFKPNDTYYTCSVYVIISALIIIAGTWLLFHLGWMWQIFTGGMMWLYHLLSPLILGSVVAYFLDPLVNFFDQKCMNEKWMKHHGQTSKDQIKTRWHMRTVPTCFAFLILILFISIFVLVVSMNMSQMVGKTSLESIRESFLSYLEYFHEMLKRVQAFAPNLAGEHRLQRFYNGFQKRMEISLNHLIGSLSQIGMGTLNFFLAFVIAFYLLQDKEKILAILKNFFKQIIPPTVYSHLYRLVQDIDYVFSGYIRGQVLDAVIIGALSSAILTLLKIDFAVIIGIMAGIFNLIPYFGPLVGTVLAAAIALLGSHPIKAVYVILALFVLQQIDGWIIVPKVVGQAVKLPPVMVLLAILIGGNLMGLFGMLIGVPVAAFIRLVLLRYMTDFFPDQERSLEGRDAVRQKNK